MAFELSTGTAVSSLTGPERVPVLQGGVAKYATVTQIVALAGGGGGGTSAVFTPTLNGLAPASGGGTATFLRADGTWAAPPSGSGTGDVTYVSLATTGGTAYLGHVSALTSAQARTLSKRLDDTCSLLDFIPESLHAAIKAGTSTTNVASYIQTVINDLDALGGGTVDASAGLFYCTSSIALKKNVTIRGAGRLATTFYFTSTNGFTSTWAINSSTAAHITLRDLRIQAPTSNTGIGFWETGGSFVTVYNVAFRGFKYHIAFDQTECSHIDLCDFEYDNVDTTFGNAAVWFVAGAELTTGSSPNFTNQLTLSRSQFNGQSSAIAFRDDGGVAHIVRDNNFNGFKHHIHAAGAIVFDISGNEFEANASDQIKFDSVSPPGVSKGQCSAVTIRANECSPTGTTTIVNVVSLGTITVGGNYFSAGNTAGAIIGGNIFTGIDLGNTHANNYPIFKDNPTNFLQLNQFNGQVLASGGIGYRTGYGGAVTQATSKATGVTLNKASGAVTMNAASLAATTAVSFTLTNSLIAATDVVLVSIKSGATAGAYAVTVDAVAAGSCQVSLYNRTAGALAEAVVLNFAVVKAVAS